MLMTTAYHLGYSDFWSAKMMKQMTAGACARCRLTAEQLLSHCIHSRITLSHKHIP
jgi:hypothetical protein